MCRKKNKFSIIAWFKIVAVALLIICMSCVTCTETETLLFHINPTTVRQYISSYRPIHSSVYFKGDNRFKQKEVEAIGQYPGEKVFKIEPSDAIDIAKYSQPAVEHHSSSGFKVPLMTLSNVRTPSSLLTLSLADQTPKVDNVPKKDSSKPMRDLRFIESASDQSLHSAKSSLGGEYKLEDENTQDMQSDMSFSEDLKTKNNFTDADTNLLPVSSEAVLSYQTPSNDEDRDLIRSKNSYKITTEHDINIASHYSEKPFSNVAEPSFISSTPSELSTETAIVFNTYHIKILNQTDSIESDFSTTIIPSSHDEANFSSGMPMLDSGKDKFSSGAVAGIVIAVLVCVTLLSSAVIYLLYRKFNGKCTSVVESKFNTDNCGYLDDSLRSSIYLNNHIELPKESSEEMSSLDNDSFLNSLETMTIQNYWADNSKNTKV